MRRFLCRSKSKERSQATDLTKLFFSILFLSPAWFGSKNKLAGKGKALKLVITKWRQEF